jgi:hypothetical protein
MRRLSVAILLKVLDSTALARMALLAMAVIVNPKTCALKTVAAVTPTHFAFQAALNDELVNAKPTLRAMVSSVDPSILVLLATAAVLLTRHVTTMGRV